MVFMVIKKQASKNKSRVGLFIPGGIFLGLGLGLLLDNLAAWMFLGMAAGFIALALTKDK